mmetsp:Transcript_14301/g.27715  ORF Transcript_14301/g.27715 Transcript_14301/m.27715 type:complete len:532 (-) Transcript_14301:60-1655(-)
MDAVNEEGNDQRFHSVQGLQVARTDARSSSTLSGGLRHSTQVIRQSLSKYDMTADRPSGSNSLHRSMKEILESPYAEYVLAIVILTNMGFIIAEVDHNGQCESDELKGEQCPTVLLHRVMNYVFLGIYTFESLTRLYTYGWSFCADRWNPFDLVIVIFGYVDIFLRLIMASGDVSSLRMLRLFRIARLARTLKIFRQLPELQNMLRGFKSAMGAMGYGFIFILFLLLISGILAVEIMHPINQDCDPDGFCKDAFLSVTKAVLLFFQTLVAGDSWGACAVPIVKKAPWTLALFAVVLVIVQLGFTNLILAVIVEKAGEAREQDKNTERRERKNGTARLANLAQQIGRSNSGTISEEEFRHGFKNEPDFRNLLDFLDIDAEDVSSLFALMDSDKSGDLSVEEFVRTLTKTSNEDVRKQMMFLRLKVICNKVGLTQKVKKMRSSIQHRIEGLEGRVTDLRLLLTDGNTANGTACSSSPPGQTFYVPRSQWARHMQFDTLAGGCFGTRVGRCFGNEVGNQSSSEDSTPCLLPDSE